MPHLELEDVSLYYEHAGSGPRLLVINGSGSDLRNKPNAWDWPIASQFEILTYDHRGLGRSAPRRPAEQPTMADFANDALALCDHVGWQSFALFGVSFGGMVGQEVAINGGRRITRAVLACTSSGGAGGASYGLHTLDDLAPEERAALSLRLMDTRTETDPQIRTAMQAFVGAGRATPAPTEGFRKQLLARAGHDTFDRLGRITAPTYVAAGRYDGIAPLPNSERLASAIPGAQLGVFEGGHGFFAQDPTAWPAMVAFLKG